MSGILKLVAISARWKDVMNEDLHSDRIKIYSLVSHFHLRQINTQSNRGI